MAHEALQKSSPWLVGSTAVRIDEHPAFPTCHTRQGLQINIGDYVHIRPPDPRADFYIARVERIYKDDSGKTLMYVHWYYRPADLQHHPPSYPKEQEVYHTMYFDSQLVESVVGHCQVVAKTDWLKLGTDERPNSRGKAGTRYFYEFSYSAEKGVFKPVKDGFPGDDTLTCSIQLGGSSMRDPATLAKDTADVLTNGERTVHGLQEILSTSWADSRQLSKYVHVTYYKEDAFHTTAASANKKAVRGSDHDQNLMKRKPVQSKLKKPRKQPRNGDMPTTSSQTMQTDFHSGMGQREASSTTTSVFQNNRLEFPIVAGSMYKINREVLPDKAPTNLKLIQTVLVAEKTATTVKVNFPSAASFKSYFGRAPNETQLDLTMDLLAGSGVPEQNIEKSMGTQPELDDEYCMPLRLAERVLVRAISCMEYMHQRHLWKFWIFESPGTNTEGLDGPENDYHQSNTAEDYDRDDESKGELGAAEALTQLIPESSMVHETCGVNDDHVKSSPVPRNEGRPFRWGMRSLRRVSFGNRSTSGHSPNNCDAGTRDPPRHDREKSRRFLEYCDQQDQNSQSKPTHDFLQTDRSSRMHPRREENVTVAVADKSKASCSRDKSRSTTKGHILKLPKDMQGRWSSERYKTAQYKLIDIMHERGAVPGKPILRPALREEARRHIGDTGLLDHLLKHMTDTVVSNGERFRRRHNAEGAMEYWLEDGSLMEIRKEAGIEDPTWMPPPGWKPGDKLPGRGEYVYGSFNRGMSAAEVAEMKKLKEIVEELKREIHSLSSRLERSKIEEITPEVEKEESEDKDMPDQHSEESPQSNLQNNTGVGQQVDNHVADIKEKASGDNMQRLETMEVEIRKLTEERKAKKRELEVDLSELRKSVSAMQEDILCIKKALGFSQQVNIQNQNDDDAITNSSARLFSDSRRATTVGQHDCDPVMIDCNGTISHDVDTRNASAKTCSDSNIRSETFNVSNEESLVVQRLGYGRDSDKGKGPENVLSAENEPNQIVHFRNRSSNGFQVCKPPGSFVWPNAATITLPSQNLPRTFRIEDVLPVRKYSPAQNPGSSHCHGNILDSSSETPSARVIFNVAGSHEQDNFGQSFPHQPGHNLLFSQRSSEHAFDTNSFHSAQVQHGQALNGVTSIFNWMPMETSLHARRPFQNSVPCTTRLTDVHRDPAHSHDGLAILSVAANCNSGDKGSRGPDYGQEIQPTPFQNAKNFFKEADTNMPASYSESGSYKISTHSSTSKGKASSWLGLAPPTSNN